MQRVLPPAFAVAGLFALALTACGGSGSPGASRIAQPSDLPEEAHIVVEYDHDKNDTLDVLTLDPSTEPMTIVEALEGDGEGDLLDRTAERAGQAIDASLSEALASYLAGTLNMGGEATIEATDVHGDTVTIKVYE